MQILKSKIWFLFLVLFSTIGFFVFVFFRPISFNQFDMNSPWAGPVVARSSNSGQRLEMILSFEQIDPIRSHCDQAKWFKVIMPQSRPIMFNVDLSGEGTLLVTPSSFIIKGVSSVDGNYETRYSENDHILKRVIFDIAEGFVRREIEAAEGLESE